MTLSFPRTPSGERPKLPKDLDLGEIINEMMLIVMQDPKVLTMTPDQLRGWDFMTQTLAERYHALRNELKNFERAPHSHKDRAYPGDYDTQYQGQNPFELYR